jgi:hypothetical protein
MHRQRLIDRGLDPNYTSSYEYRAAKKYGVTEDQIAQMMADQGGRCAICMTSKPGGKGNRLHIDHDHETGIVRGLLCTKCNVALGQLGDNIFIVGRALKYLQRHQLSAISAWTDSSLRISHVDVLVPRSEGQQ